MPESSFHQGKVSPFFENVQIFMSLIRLAKLVSRVEDLLL